MHQPYTAQFRLYVVNSKKHLSFKKLYKLKFGVKKLPCEFSKELAVLYNEICNDLTILKSAFTSANSNDYFAHFMYSYKEAYNKRAEAVQASYLSIESIPPPTSTEMPGGFAVYNFLQKEQVSEHIEDY